MKNNILFGIIGVGHLGKFHAQQALQVPNINVVGVYDDDKKRAKEISAQYQVNYFDDIELLLKSCDAVSIVTPAMSHYSLAMKALKNNCHVFIEKPFTVNLEDAHKILNQAKTNNKLIQVGHIERFNPVFTQFIKSSPRPLFIEAERLTPFNKRGTDVDVVLDLMIHDINLILALLNSKIKNVSANGVSILSKSSDLVNARLEFENGCIANLTASRLSVKPLRKLRVFEKNMYSSLDLQKSSIEKYIVLNKKKFNQDVVFEFKNSVVKKESILIEKQNALYEELVSFSESIQNQQLVAVDGKDAIKTLELALLIQQKINAQ